MLVRLNEESETLATREMPTHTSTAPAMSPAESRRVLAAFNNNSARYQRKVSLHQLFEAQVERTPEATSLVFRNERLTYRELNARANQVANRLRKLGIGPETLVGIYMERSLEMVIAMYGILKAGGAYLPLDPSYPQERLEFMLADANVPVLLTQAHLQSAIRNPQSAIIVCLDTEWESIVTENSVNFDSGAKEEHLAYVIYTSGSTGQPKGVMIEHRGICNQLQWMQAQYPLTTDDAVLLKTPFSFDLSLYEFFSPLIAGAKLVIAEPDGQRDSAYLVELIQREQITTLFMVPSLLQILMEHEAFPDCVSLKDIFCSGEPLPFPLQQRFFARMPHTGLHNLYGPTEASVECTYWDCERDTRRNIVPIGRPIANYQIYLLDEQLKPVPVGQVGELFIGGIGLARGYWNRPALTAEKFVVSRFASQVSRHAEDPNNPKLETRLYRTGDLARWLPDGVIECLGRVDFQVKIRGHRIELGEIEAVLTTHPAVRESVVAAREDALGDKQLVAYYLAESETQPTNNELRRHLKQTLPGYMIPAAFVCLESFPLSPNGKLDRQQLPAPEAIHIKGEVGLVAPTNEVEAALQQIWEQALRIAPVGVTENFFELGGHSLLALHIFKAIEKRFGQHLPLATLFRFPTVCQLAHLLTAHNWKPSWSSLVPLQEEGDNPPFFCVHAIGGNVLEYYELARQMGASQPFFGLQSVGLDGQQAPLTSIEAMAAHYIQEIRQLQPRGPYYLGGRSFGGVVAYEMAQQLREQGQEVGLVALLDTDPIGWLKLFPRRTALKLQAHFLVLRVKRHLTNLRGLSLPTKLNYVREKVAYKKRKLETWRWQLSQVLQPGRKRSNILRDVEEFNYLAAEKYVPRTYADQVAFFCACEEVSAPENQHGWKTLATGGVEIVEVPGDHQSMIQAPHVQFLADQLKLRLTRNTTKNHDL